MGMSRPDKETDEIMIFLSYSSDNAVEADLLQFAYETLLADVDARVWTYERDQAKDEKAIAERLKTDVRMSRAVVFLVTPSTLSKGAVQWMELAYADAFDVPTFVLLHQLSFQDLRAQESGVPPLLLAAQCNSAKSWREIARDLKEHCSNSEQNQRK
jgi:hypothetical protein